MLAAGGGDVKERARRFIPLGKNPPVFPVLIGGFAEARASE